MGIKTIPFRDIEDQAENPSVNGIIIGIIFCGVVIRGETTHYELVTTETFREIGNLALDYPDIAIINNVICVENEEQLKIRNKKNTLSNVKALKTLAKSKQEFKGPERKI